MMIIPSLVLRVKRTLVKASKIVMQLKNLRADSTPVRSKLDHTINNVLVIDAKNVLYVCVCVCIFISGSANKPMLDASFAGVVQLLQCCPSVIKNKLLFYFRDALETLVRKLVHHAWLNWLPE